jgi:hypothetical protein
MAKLLGSSPAAGTLLRRQLSKRLCDGARYPNRASHEMAVIGVCH